MSANPSTLSVIRENASTDLYIQFSFIWVLFYVGFGLAYAVLGGGETLADVVFVWGLSGLAAALMVLSYIAEYYYGRTGTVAFFFALGAGFALLAFA